MQQLQGTPTLRPVLHHDWTRKYFSHRPARPDWDELVDSPFVFPGTGLEYLHRSAEGFEGAVLAARNPKAAPGRRPFVLWHGRHRLLEEAFRGWFGKRLQPVRTESFRLLLDRLPRFLIANASTQPTYVISLPAFGALGVSHGVLETVLDAKVIVAAEGLFAKAAHVPSLRVYVEYDGNRYGDGSKKLFYDSHGSAASVEAVAREILGRLAYDAVNPNVFHRMFLALVNRPASHFGADVWPDAFLNGRLSPLEWVMRAHAAIDRAHADGARSTLEKAFNEWRQRPLPEGVLQSSLPVIGRYLSRARYDSLMDALGDERIVSLWRGLANGYSSAAADWFAWQPGGERAFFCEVKSRGDTLRPYQKETILWCQRSGILEYRLLEVLHNVDEASRKDFEGGPASTDPACPTP